MIEGYIPIAKVDDIKPGDRKIVRVKGKEFGVFNIEGTFHIILNRCPHMGAPLCMGRLTKEIQAEKPGKFSFSNKILLRCPWHGWEFDLNSGMSIFDRSIQVKKYSVKIKAGTIYCKL